MTCFTKCFTFWVPNFFCGFVVVLGRKLKQIVVWYSNSGRLSNTKVHFWRPSVLIMVRRTPLTLYIPFWRLKFQCVTILVFHLEKLCPSFVRIHLDWRLYFLLFFPVLWDPCTSPVVSVSSLSYSHKRRKTTTLFIGVWITKSRYVQILGCQDFQFSGFSESPPIQVW